MLLNINIIYIGHATTTADTNAFGGVCSVHNVIYVCAPKTLCDPDCPCRVVKTKTFVYDCILYEGRVRGCHVARAANGAKTPTPPCCSSATTKNKNKKRSVGPPAGAAGRARRTDNRSARSITHGDAGRRAGATRVHRCESAPPPPKTLHRPAGDTRVSIALSPSHLHVVVHRDRNIIARRFSLDF